MKQIIKDKTYENFLNSDDVKKILAFHMPRWSELPNIELYMDQVLTFINSAFSDINFNNDKNLTKSMINNYVKNQVISAPEKKKYNRSHLVYLTVIIVFKDVFSLSEIASFINLQGKSYSIDIAYDYFCNEIENVLIHTFNKDSEIPYIAHHSSKEIDIVRSGVLAMCNKLFAQSYINYLEKEKLI